MRGYMVTRMEHQRRRISECQHMRRSRGQNAADIMRRVQSDTRMGFSERYNDWLHRWCRSCKIRYCHFLLFFMLVRTSPKISVTFGLRRACLQMWSMDYVQVPAEEEKPEEVVVAKEKNEGQSNEENQTETTKKRVHELVKQMSISAEGSSKRSVIIS